MYTYGQKYVDMYAVIYLVKLDVHIQLTSLVHRQNCYGSTVAVNKLQSHSTYLL